MVRTATVFFISFILLFIVSCKKPIIEASFYYWKTKFDISKTEKKVLSQLQCKTIYTRFFDVDIDPDGQVPIPVGIIKGLDSIPGDLDIVPVVFITNRTFLNRGKADVSKLANNIFKKINSIKNNYTELQFDCDWSAKTKENYFLFLEEAQKLAPKNCLLSCTIRLHQVKYAFKTGIPPVGRGVLMFYNMGSVSRQDESNSIFDQKNAEKYTAYLKNYALPLDVALPVFKWYAHYRDEALLELLTKQQFPAIKDTNHFLPIENNTKFIVRTGHFENGIFYRANDVLKFESLKDEELLLAAKIVSENLKAEKRKVIFYDLDEENINYYDKETFKKVIALFN